MTLEQGKRKSSTKGRHIKQINPLAKGKSCLTCRQRKVRCTAERPACQACLRTARFEGRDLSTVQCAYTENSASKSRGGKAKEAKEAIEDRASWRLPDNNHAAQESLSGGELDGSPFEESDGGTPYQPLLTTANLLPEHDPSARLIPSAPWNAWPQVSLNLAPPSCDITSHPYSATPPLTYSSASSPAETAVSSPPTPSISPAPTSIVQPTPGSYVPYFQPFPPVYPPSNHYTYPTSTLPQPYPCATAQDHAQAYTAQGRSSSEFLKLSPFPQQYQPQYLDSSAACVASRHPPVPQAYPQPQGLPPSNFANFAANREKMTMPALSQSSAPFFSAQNQPFPTSYLAHTPLLPSEQSRNYSLASSTGTPAYPILPHNH